MQMRVPNYADSPHLVCSIVGKIQLRENEKVVRELCGTALEIRMVASLVFGIVVKVNT